MTESFLALIITIIIEAIVIWAFLKPKFPQLMLYVAIINAITQPLATLLYWYLLPSLIIVEIFVWLAEIFLIKLLFQIDWQKAALISFAANLVTFLISLIINYII